MSRHPGVPCFWLEPTGQVRLSLRRFTFGERGRDCPATNAWGHGASAWLDREIEMRWRDDDGFLVMAAVPDEERPADDDPRWPAACEACGGPFEEADERQLNQTELYTRSDTGAEVAFRGYQDAAMAGALWHGWWLAGAMGGVRKAKAGPDGIILMAMTPGGYEWVVDGEATGGGHWAREGDPRRPETLTVTPSIIAGNYHGFLTGGRFTDDIG